MGNNVSSKFVDDYIPNITKEKLNKKKNQLRQSFKKLPKDIAKKFSKELTQKSAKKILSLHIIGEELPIYVEKIVKKLKCSVNKKVSWSPILPYCEGKEWSKKTTLPLIGYHATSLENYNKIIKNGFHNHSLFTHSVSILQSLQVGERHGEKYVILLCLFNTKKFIDYEEFDKLKDGDNDWKKIKKKLEKYSIDGIYSNNIDSIHISKRKNISIFGYIKYENGIYKIYLF